MKILYLIRGLPGSGKSTLANRLTNSKQVEADMYFAMTGEYKFDPTKLKEAHEWCRKECLQMMEAGKTPIAVSNTFTQAWEMDAYQKLAKQFGYEVFTLTCENDFGNCHGVPPEKIRIMAERWEPAHPELRRLHGGA